jgi:hypothetical protein
MKTVAGVAHTTRKLMALWDALCALPYRVSAPWSSTHHHVWVSSSSMTNLDGSRGKLDASQAFWREPMKYNSVVTWSLIAGWILMLVFLVFLHWRPARVMMPIIGVIMLAYVGACGVHAILAFLDKEKEKKDAHGLGEKTGKPKRGNRNAQ